MTDRDDRLALLRGIQNALIIEGIVCLVIFLIAAVALNTHAIWSAL